jgi:hypothetical protein
VTEGLPLGFGWLIFGLLLAALSYFLLRHPR